MESRGFLIVFPSVKQIQLIFSMSFHEKSNIYIILREQNIYKYSQYSSCCKNNIIYFNEEDAKSIQFLKNETLKVLCCHEEAIFWCLTYQGAKWEYSFDPIYFSILEKHKFKKFFEKSDITIAHYSISPKDISLFPVIAKPSIGFGSIGVRIIDNASTLREYVKYFATMLKTSEIHKYQIKYFRDRTNFPIFEEAINGNFYRTPFIVKGKRCDEIFPIRGVSKRVKKITDFNWVEFEYSPNDISIVEKQIFHIHELLVKYLNLDDGVYISEFIVSNIGEIFLLEFSPRQPSSRISKIVYLSTGIDLEEYAICCLFKKPCQFQHMKNKRTIRLRLENIEESFSALDDYDFIEENLEKSVHGEQIKCLYFMRLDK